MKQSDLGQYKENVREKKNINIQGKKHQLPLKPSHTDGKHQVPPAKKQNEKNQGVW